MKRDTPRTDEVLNTFDGKASKLAADLATHAEKLERELTAVTEQRDRLAENLERALNATVLNNRRDRWHIDAEYTLQLIQSLTTKTNYENRHTENR